MNNNQHILGPLEEILGYHFSNRSLLTQALTHRSASRVNYERLEFLGDSFMGSVVALHLYKLFPQADEGLLSRNKAAMVSEHGLVPVSKALGLPQCAILGVGETKEGVRESIMADMVEAVIGAVLLDGGYAAAEELVNMLIRDYMVKPSGSMASMKDPKTALQEILQGRCMDLPEYNVQSVTGAAHNQVFTIELRCALGSTVGVGSSRRKAEQNAAQCMLDSIKDSKEADVSNVVTLRRNA